MRSAGLNLNNSFHRMFMGLPCFQNGVSQNPISEQVTLHPLQREADALSYADAERCKRTLAAGLFQLMQRREHETRPAHAQGMAERDGAAIRIDLFCIIGKS